MSSRIRLALSVLSIPAAIILAGFVLSAISPWQQPGPIIRLLVGAERSTAAAFDSRALACTSEEMSGRGDAFRLRTECTLEIAGKPLVVRVAHQGMSGRCEASYDGATLPCESNLALYNSPLPSVFVRNDLGLNPAALRRLPGTNPLFYVTERDWFGVQLGLAAVITIGALLISRGIRLSMPSLSFGALARGVGQVLGVGLLSAGVWYLLLWPFLFSGLVD